jgi:hypothetical protein
MRAVVPGGVWMDAPGAHEPVRDLALRAVNAEDEVCLLESASAAVAARATALLARCLDDGERIAGALTVGDREALLLQLRRATFGERLDAIVRCPARACGQPMELTLAVGDLLVPPYREVRRWHDLAVDLDGARYALSFRLPIASDVDQVAGIARTDPVAAARELARRAVRRVERDGRPIDAAELPGAVTARLGAAMADLDPQAEVELALRCPFCDGHFTMIFDVSAFFLCELDGRGARLLADVHVLASHYHWSERDILRLPSSRRAAYLDLIAGAANRGSAR